MRDVEEAVNQYIASAIDHGRATELGESDRINQFHDRLIAAYRVLADVGEEGLRCLLPLMGHENESVRGWSATHCLDLEQSKAEKTLRELSHSSSIIGFNAKIVLSEWTRGTLNVPK